MNIINQKRTLVSRGLNVVSGAIGLLLLITSHQVFSDADIPTPQVRAHSAVAGFGDTKQFALAVSFDYQGWLQADRTELAFGGIEGNVGTSAFVSYGPVWRWQAFSPAMFVELGFSPTLIGDDQFSDDSTLGGHIHFTSSAAIGRTFGGDRNTELSLRLQHTSNGGLDDINPGLDLLGFSLIVNFSAG